MGIDILKGYVSRIFGKDDEVYSMSAATVFCLVLSAVLWWVPVLGAAVAGYVCGRKTGSTIKGAFCALVSGLVVMGAVLLLSKLILGANGYPDVPADQAAASMTGLAGAVASYLQTFFNEGTASLNLANLGIVAVFGLVGGVLSGQMRKETAHLLSLGSTEFAVRPAARSMELYSKGRSMGFECFNDCIVMQDMMTNENPNSKRSEQDSTPNAKRPPVATTVQTVTTTVPNQNATRTENDGSPFADILQRSERRKKDGE